MEKYYEIKVFEKTYKVRPIRTTYPANDTLAVILMDDEGFQFCVLTVNLRDSFLLDKKNLVNIRTAKIHEYTTSLILQLEDLAGLFFASKKEPWERHKQILDRSVEAVMDQIGYLDSL